MNDFFLEAKKALIASFLFFSVSFSNIEIIMKLITFVITVGFILRQWYVFEKKNK
jgi:hypothetical protein